jgi:enolase-phosphatase E1
MSIDRKIGPLKAFQGYLWKSAYEQGKIRGVVYDDVVQALKVWKERNIHVYIYSSGSVPAQKLLFGYSNQGDLLPRIQGHFDTCIGSKLDKQSYIKIAKEIGSSPPSILFLSDNILECLAAREAGYQVVNVDRPGNASITDLHGIAQVKSFKELEAICKAE